MEKTCENIILWLKNAVKDAGAIGTVFGLSGGLDSSVAGALCKKAFGKNALGIIMPCYSDGEDVKDALFVANKFEINHITINLDSVYDEFLAQVEKGSRISRANIKPRLRMLTLYYYASIKNFLVVGAENKSEITIGYFTKYGDGAVDLLPLANLVKSEVKQLASYLQVPKKIIQKTPSAGLWKGQTDEGELGFSYEDLDSYIMTGKVKSKLIEERISNLIAKSNHKRKMPLTPNR